LSGSYFCTWPIADATAAVRHGRLPGSCGLPMVSLRGDRLSSRGRAIALPIAGGSRNFIDGSIRGKLTAELRRAPWCRRAPPAVELLDLETRSARAFPEPRRRHCHAEGFSPRSGVGRPNTCLWNKLAKLSPARLLRGGICLKSSRLLSAQCASCSRTSAWARFGVICLLYL
jgi:hypothetical protein